MKKSVIITGSLLILGGLLLSACQKNADESKESNVLKVGTEGTYSPFSYRNEKDELTGYDVEVAKAIGKKINYDIEFVEAPWDAMLAAFESNKTDVVFNQVAITPERTEKYALTDPYSVTHAALIVKNDNEDLTDFSALKGKTAAQSLTSNYAQMAQDFGAKISSVDGFSKAVELVTSGRADATLNDDVVFYDYLKQKPNAPLKLVATSEDKTEIAAMFHKEDEALVKKVNEAIKELENDGTFTKLSEKYFNQDISK